MHTVRKQILEILKEHGGATVAEIAGNLEMAPVSVRHHLDLLQGDNLICVERVRRKGQVGRPQQIYGLTNDANALFPNNFACLAESLVRQIKAVLPPEQVQGAFRSIASEIAGELDESALDNASLDERLEHVTAFLSARGYLARWELAGESAEEGYLLHKHNCPYAGVSAEHRELCCMDQELVDMLVGHPCHRVQSMAEDGQCCTYRIESGEIVLSDSVPSDSVLAETHHKDAYPELQLTGA